MITYIITVCEELEIFKTSLENITGSLIEGEKLLIQYDSNSGSVEVKNFLDSNNIFYIEYPYNGDYSDIKNHALQNATTNWIFHLEGDEYIQSGSLEINRNYINICNKINDAFFVKRNDINTDTNEIKQDIFVRLFKNRKWIKWVGKNHDVIMGYERPEFINDYQINHLRTTEQISASISK